MAGPNQRPSVPTIPGPFPAGPNAPQVSKPPSPPRRPPPPRQPAPLPPDPQYTLAQGAAQQQLNTTLSGIQYNRTRAQQEYGFDDTSDPYNRAAMLERAYHQSQSGTLNQEAGRGQLYSGALQSNLDEGRYQYERNRSDLRRQYEDLLHGYTQSEAQARAGYRTTLAGAEGDRIDRALANQPEDPGKPAKQGTNPGRGRSLASKLWKAGKGHGPKWREVIDMLGYDPRTPNGLKFRP
jgi:hypothetical protein